MSAWVWKILAESLKYDILSWAIALKIPKNKIKGSSSFFIAYKKYGKCLIVKRKINPQFC